MKRSSRSRAIGRIGFATAPARAIARYATMVSHQFGSCSATTSPGPPRSARSAPASRVARAATSAKVSRCAPSTIAVRPAWRAAVAANASQSVSARQSPRARYVDDNGGTTVGRSTGTRPPYGGATRPSGNPLTRRPKGASIDAPPAACVRMPAMPRAAAFACALALVAMPVLAQAVALKDNLFAVTATSDEVAWAVGNFGSIYVTRNAGKGWLPRPSKTRRPLFSIAFADERTGWVVGKSGTILHTADGGQTWETQRSPIEPAKHLFKVAAVDARTAWAVGDWGAVVQTRDGGATWRDRSLGALPVERIDSPDRMMQTITDDVILYDVSFLDGRHGFICGEFGTLLATDDGGEHWRQIAVPTEKTLFGLYFATPLEGWVVGIDGIM